MEQLSRRQLLLRGGLVAGGLALPASAWSAPPSLPMTVFHDPGCSCCMKWVEAMRSAGFTAVARKTADMAAVKLRLRVPGELASCHTSLVGTLVVEGHVPAEPIRRLIARRPAGIIGIAAPGMPRGSPGMEMPDGSVDPLNLTIFTATGAMRAFA